MELNYLKLYFSLTLTGLTIWGVDEAFDLYKLNVVADEVTEAMNKSKLESKSAAIRAQTEALKQRTRQAAIAKQNALKQETINNARKTNNEICSFWSNEYYSERTDRNKTMMQGACERAAKTPNTSTSVINLKGTN